MTTISKPRLGFRQALIGSATLGLASAMALAPLPRLLGGIAHAQTTTTHGHSSGTTRVSPSGKGGYGQMGKTGTADSGTSTDESDKKGPKFSGGTNTRKPDEGTRGGRPAWAKEGIPSVELGRLNVARAPKTVIDKALATATADWATTSSTLMTLTAVGQPTLTMTVAQFYSLPAAEFARIVATYYESVTRIDSPLENLALLREVRTTGTSPLAGVTPASANDLVAIFLGSASDKTIPISVATVTAVNTILGLPALTPESTSYIAAQAEAVRLAILAGHG